MGAIELKLGARAPEQVWIRDMGVESEINGSLCAQNCLIFILARKMLAEVEGRRGLFGYKAA